MYNIFDSLFFNQDNWAWKGCVSLAFCVLGSISITLAFWPGFYHTWKTKDTKFLPIGLFTLFLIVGILMTAGSIAGVIGKSLKTWQYVRGGWFIYLNAFVMLVNAYTVGLSLINKKREEKLASRNIKSRPTKKAVKS